MKYCIVIFITFISVFQTLAQNWPEHIISTDVESTLKAIVADIDGDTFIDVLSVQNFPAENFVWFRNEDGLGNFGSLQLIGSINEPRFIATADIDGDNDLDMIGTSPFAPTDRLVWYENLDGLGTFGTANQITTTTSGQFAVVGKDIDGDTDIDLVVCSRDDGTLAWYENLDGLGSFGPSQVIVSNYVTFTGLAVGDIDGDSDLDIVAGTPNTNRMSWFENSDGLGTFTTITEVSSPGLAILSVALADFDGDSDLDIVGTSAASDLVAWYENLDGQGTFSSERTITTSIDVPFDLFVTDLDNDTDIDILVTSASAGAVFWFENLNGQGTFSAEKIVSDELDATITVFAADLDGDGDQDVISGTQGNKLAWYENETILATEEHFISNIKISPNPVSDMLYINSGSTQLTNVVIHNTLGQQVYNSGEDLTVINLSYLPAGIYFVMLVTESDQKITKKIVKN